MGKTTKPFVTLLCSTFNSAKWIEGYLECLNDQILENFDIVFVDAGSTDGSLQTIMDFEFRDGIGAKTLVQHGCSVYEAWNLAVAEARTPYVMNFNTDDRLFSYGLVTAEHLTKNHSDVDMFYFPCFLMSDEKHETLKAYNRRDIPFKRYNLDEHCICGPFPLVKTEAIREMGGFDESLKISGDYDMWTRMCYAGKTLMPAKEPIGSYYDNPKGISTDESKRDLHFQEDRSIRRAQLDKQKKVITFSLWGDNPVYTIGAVKNAELAETVYPGWECWFYVGQSVPADIVQTLEAKDNCKVIKMDEEGDWDGMFWRFIPASDPEVDIMISRDTDSRLNSREAGAVTEWLEMGKRFHIMRDHPHHGTQILGGMWGVRGDILSNMEELVGECKKGNYWQVDQDFLKEKIYPVIEPYAHVNDEFFQKVAFPTTRKGKLFIGQAYNEHDQPLHPEHMDEL